MPATDSKHLQSGENGGRKIPPLHRARHIVAEAGRYTFSINASVAGEVSVAVSWITPDRGVRSVLLVTGKADPEPGQPLLVACDPYDATRTLEIY